MIEIIYIFCQLFIFLILFTAPLSFNLINSKKLISKKINFFDFLNFNTIIITFFFLLFSLFNFKINVLINFLLFLSCILLIYNFKKLFKLVIQNKNDLIIYLIYCLTLISIFFFIANNLKFGWDALAHWFWKVQLFHQGGQLSNFNEIPNSMYPHLGSYIWSSFWSFSNSKFEYLGRFYYIFFYVTAIFSILIELKTDKKILLIIFVPFLVFDHQALSGYQDILIFSLVLSASRCFFLLKNIPICKLVLLVLILILILLPWCKQEGIFISLILLITFLFSIKLKLSNKFIISILIFFSYIVYIFLEIHFKGSYGFHEPLRSSDLIKYNDVMSFMFDFKSITEHFIIGIFKRPILLIGFIGIIYLYFFNRKSLLKHNYLIIFLLLHTLYIYFIYFYSSFGLDILPMTLGRLLLQSSGFYLIALLLIFNRVNFDEK